MSQTLTGFWLFAVLISTWFLPLDSDGWLWLLAVAVLLILAELKRTFSAA